MNEKEITTALASFRDHTQRYEFMLPNVFIQHDSEADLFAIRKSGFCDEFEVKISRSDLLADKKKRVAYRALDREEWGWKEQGLEFCPSTKPKYEALVDGDLKVNYFWYVLRDGIGTEADIPEFAGLIYVSDDLRFRVVRHPKRLHKNKLTGDEKYHFARLAQFRFWDIAHQKRRRTNAIEHAEKLKESRNTVRRLRHALEYSESYLSENKLNTIGHGSKAHREMIDALERTGATRKAIPRRQVSA